MLVLASGMIAMESMIKEKFIVLVECAELKLITRVGKRGQSMLIMLLIIIGRRQTVEKLIEWNM